MVGLLREFPLFQGNLGWWNIMPFGQMISTPRKTNMTMEKTSMNEDVLLYLPLKNGWFSIVMLVVCLLECIYWDAPPPRNNVVTGFHLGKRDQLIQLTEPHDRMILTKNWTKSRHRRTNLEGFVFPGFILWPNRKKDSKISIYKWSNSCLTPSLLGLNRCSSMRLVRLMNIIIQLLTVLNKVWWIL